jgi:hypothetical protein
VKKYTKLLAFVMSIVFLSHFPVAGLETRSTHAFHYDGTNKPGKGKKSKTNVKKTAMVSKRKAAKATTAATTPNSLSVPALNMSVYGLNPNRSGQYRSAEVRVVNPNPKPLVKIPEGTDPKKPYAWLDLNCTRSGVLVRINAVDPDFDLTASKNQVVVDNLKSALALSDVSVNRSELILQRANWTAMDVNKIRPTLQANLPDYNVQEMLYSNCRSIPSTTVSVN